MFSRSQIPSYAIDATTLATTTITTVAAAVQLAVGDDNNLMQFESQQQVESIRVVSEAAPASAHIMDETADSMLIDTGNLGNGGDTVVEVVEEAVAAVQKGSSDSRKTTLFNSRLPLVSSIPRASHRHSLPHQPTGLDRSLRAQGPSPSRIRKSLSPRHMNRRSSASQPFNTVAAPTSTVPLAFSSSISTSSAALLAGTIVDAAPSSNGTLLALPLAAQFAALKARHAQLEKSAAASASAQLGDLARARGRIGTLEKMVEGVENERDGWQSEASRMTGELAALDAAAAPGSIPTSTSGEDIEATQAMQKKVKALLKDATKEAETSRRYKSLNDKLRCELESRKLKERWDLGIMDADDRKEEARAIGLEHDLTRMVLKETLRAIEREELEEQLAFQQTQISSLTAARSILLNSYKASQSTLSSIRSELIGAGKELARERESASIIKRDLVRTKATLKGIEAEASEAKERCTELEANVEVLSNQVVLVDEAKEKSDEKERQRQVVELKKSLEKEKTKREKIEADAKELKSSLKSTQAELGHAKTSVNAATKAAELATRSAEIAQATMLAAAGTFTATSAAKATVSAAPSKPKATKKRKSIPAAIDSEEEEQEAEDAIVTEDADTSISDMRAAAKARAKKMVAAPVLAVVASPASPSASDDESYATLRLVAPAPATSKTEAAAKKVKQEKVKVVVLGEKSTNEVSKIASSKVVVALTGEKKKQDGAKDKARKRESVALVEAEVEGDDEENEEPSKKKKKRSLFAKGAKKFEWGTAHETTDINTYGLPSALSPVKGSSYSSLFGAMKGMSGRPSAFK